ncbi:MAG: response regulator transcription factor [Nitrospiraceae bacterium]|nr:response regulator transcription factor [Nitrospiraceae bacterium]
MDTISVVIADTKQAARAAYLQPLRRERGIRVIGEARTRDEVIRILKRKPRILLLDWRLVALGGTRLLPLIRRHSPDTRIILLISRLSSARLIDVFSGGVRGYVSRALADHALVKAVRAVDSGQAWIPRSMVSLLVTVVNRLAHINR